MAEIKLSKSDLARIDKIVEFYPSIKDALERQAMSLESNLSAIKPLVHSIKWRLKDEKSLHAKLMRKYLQAKNKKQSFDVTKENLHQKINDLIGFRILHLNTSEMKQIDPQLRSIFREQYLKLLPRHPFARIWDDEYRQFFKEIGIRVESSANQYTSVHYAVEIKSALKNTAEIQVRSLAEELWGEVDHAINYPKKSPSLACREQLRVLARATSTCTRLVDSIFRTHDDYHISLKKNKSE